MNLSITKRQTLILMLSILLFPAFGQYTLSDQDVSIDNGIIQSCTYSFSETAIIIPELLNEQTVTGIAASVFQSKGLTEVQLPATIHSIGDDAFRNNVLTAIDLSSCTSLMSIGYNAFNDNTLTQYILPTPAIDDFVYFEGKIDDWNLSQLYHSNVVADNLSLAYEGVISYTLQDGDVVVIDGEIQRCLNPIPSSALVIPNELQGQSIRSLGGYSTGKTNGVSTIAAVFANRRLSSIVLPNTLEKIGACTFKDNQLFSVDISHCQSLMAIGEEAFLNNHITEFELPTATFNAFTNWYDVIGNEHPGGTSVIDLQSAYVVPVDYVIGDDDVVVKEGEIVFCEHINGSVITIPSTLDEQTIIGIHEKAFINKGIISVHLPPTLEFIDDEAFIYNAITQLNLTECTKLVKIGMAAFGYGTIKNLTLPVSDHDSFDGWQNEEGMLLAGGTSLDYNGSCYIASIPYVLQSDDVEVVDGTIVECKALNGTVITIPSNIDGQTIVGIGEKAFYKKGISAIVFPSSLIQVEKMAFADNYLTNIDFSNLTNLVKVSYRCFSDNLIKHLNLSNCAQLIGIGDNAFEDNRIETVDFSSCSSLRYIGSRAFSTNTISSVDFSNCTQLQNIADKAFERNSLSTISLASCPQLVSIGASTFFGNFSSSTTIDLSQCTNLSYIGNRSFYPASVKLPAANDPEKQWIDGRNRSYDTGASALTTYGLWYPTDYTLQAGDVEIENGYITKLNQWGGNSIIIPESIDGQVITGIGADAIYFKSLHRLKLPSSIEYIKRFAIRYGYLNEIDLSSCSQLKNIETSSLHMTLPRGSTMDLSHCTSIDSIMPSAFRATYVDHVILPQPDDLSFESWYDSNGNSYLPNAPVAYDNQGFYRQYSTIPYTLSDDDVVVEDGIIISCTYIGGNDVTVPELLDDQAVRGIADSVFFQMDIVNFHLPNTLVYIGQDALFTKYIQNIDLPSPKVEGADFKYWLSSNYTDAWFVANNVPTTKAYEAIYNETTTTDIDPSLSTEEKLLIYPNPSTGIITIQCNRKITNLVLTDLSGRIVAQKACTHHVNDLNISACPTGVYLLIAKDGKTIIGQQKVIKR